MECYLTCPTSRQTIAPKSKRLDCIGTTCTHFFFMDSKHPMPFLLHKWRWCLLTLLVLLYNLVTVLWIFGKSLAILLMGLTTFRVIFCCNGLDQLGSQYIPLSILARLSWCFSSLSKHIFSPVLWKCDSRQQQWLWFVSALNPTCLRPRYSYFTRTN